MKIKQIIVPALLVLILYLSSWPKDIYCQEGSDSAASITETRLRLEYLGLSNDSVKLTGSLDSKRNDVTRSLQHAVLSFFAGDGITEIPVGQAKTDQEGKATVIVSVKGIPVNVDGAIVYNVRFTGNDHYPGNEDQIIAKPARIQMTFNNGDSLRIVDVNAITMDLKGNTAPLAGETVLLYVPKLFSLLKVGEIALDETGAGTAEFPNDIVGDSLGNLTVIARIEEHDVYGFVQTSGIIDWGIPKHLIQAERPTRELWTPVAPLWMIITLITMLVGVWAHYVYVVYELFMIKKLSKKKAQS